MNSNFLCFTEEEKKITYIITDLFFGGVMLIKCKLTIHRGKNEGRKMKRKRIGEENKGVKLSENQSLRINEASYHPGLQIVCQVLNERPAQCWVDTGYCISRRSSKLLHDNYSKSGISRREASLHSSSLTLYQDTQRRRKKITSALPSILQVGVWGMNCVWP